MLKSAMDFILCTPSLLLFSVPHSVLSLCQSEMEAVRKEKIKVLVDWMTSHPLYLLGSKSWCPWIDMADDERILLVFWGNSLVGKVFLPNI